MKRLLVAAAVNYVALHGRRTQLAFAAATSTDHSRHPAEPVDPPPVEGHRRISVDTLLGDRGKPSVATAPS